MNRSEFIKELRKALENNVGQAAVQENVRYYTSYIEEEVKKGRSEKEVIEELGDPWLIAKTISDAPGGSSRDYGNSNSQETYESSVGRRTDNRSGGTQIHVFGLDTWWKKALGVIVLILVLLTVIFIVTGLVTLAMKIVLPVALIVIVIKLFKKDR